MSKKLEALKALFKKEKEKKNDSGSRKRGDMYPFWHMEIDEKAVVRILPDKNPENPYMFYVDKLEHTLAINGKNERVPCLQMYGEKCPICDLSREYYKAEGKKSVNGKYYWRSKTSLVRVLVVEDPLPADEETGEKADGKVFNTQFGYQLMEKIKEEIGSDDMSDDPWDMKLGYNFNIKKTAQGDHGTYAIGSGFARRPTPIDPELAETIELIDLETLLPANPGYDAVKRKLEAHLNGTDDGDDDGDNEEQAPPPKQAKAPKPMAKPQESRDDDGDDDGDDDDNEEQAPPPKSSKKPAAPALDDDDDDDDIIARLRQRNKK